MINVIFSTAPVPFNDTPDNPSTLRTQLAQVAIWVSPVPESRNVSGRILVQGVVSSTDDIATIKTMLTNLGLAPVIVGAWDTVTGLQWGTYYGDPDPTTGVRPVQGTPAYTLDIAEYTNFLADVTTYDAQGNVTGTRRPTQTEAQSIQINRYAGMPNRALK